MEHTVDWGRTAYREAWDRQLALVERRRAGACPDTLVLTEHNPVFTIGARPGAEQHLVWTEQILARQGIEVVKTNRGGDITYHGPGQIVGYPIISLQEKRDLHGYLRELEEVLIRTVAHFGIEATRREGKTGIWIEERKVAAIGVAVKTWITYHGFALNVNPDLSHFAGIVPCGITDGTVTSLEQECSAPPLMGQVKARLVLEFWKLFGNRT
ncbi:MAG TPA: lipoyl(octanoyl) transferase LipB [Oceanipulchritudo sp.]|nr:lipoyl(octanoyl) transferase LipB [Oceanipulchritudo sp.]